MRHVCLSCVVLALFALLASLAGCGRHVVLEPRTVERLNDRAWTVKSQPRPAIGIVFDAGAPP